MLIMFYSSLSQHSCLQSGPADQAGAETVLESQAQGGREAGKEVREMQGGLNTNLMTIMLEICIMALVKTTGGKASSSNKSSLYLTAKRL